MKNGTRLLDSIWKKNKHDVVKYLKSRMFSRRNHQKFSLNLLISER